MATSPDSNSHSNGSSSRDILPRLYRRGRMSRKPSSQESRGFNHGSVNSSLPFCTKFAPLLY